MQNLNKEKECCEKCLRKEGEFAPYPLFPICKNPNCPCHKEKEAPAYIGGVDFGKPDEDWKGGGADEVNDRLKDEKENLVKEIIDSLEDNPNEDGSTSPNIQYHIEKLQSMLRKKYL